MTEGQVHADELECEDSAFRFEGDRKHCESILVNCCQVLILIYFNVMI